LSPLPSQTNGGIGVLDGCSSDHRRRATHHEELASELFLISSSHKELKAGL